MKTPIDFGKEFLHTFFDQRDADACQGMLAGDLVWITPENMHHFLSEGAVLSFLRKKIEEDGESRYVDLVSIKSSPSADNIMTVAYEINLVSREEDKPLHLGVPWLSAGGGDVWRSRFYIFQKNQSGTAASSFGNLS